MQINIQHKRSLWIFTICSLILICIFWFLNWNLEGTRTHWAFFPLWLGFILFLNSLILWRKGTCFLTQNPKQFILLFIISAPLWWVFELLNERTGYWIYLPQDWLPFWKYMFFATLNFSVVLPGILGAAELVYSYKLIHKAPTFIKTGHNAKTPMVFFLLGWIMLAVTLIWPEYSMALIWMSLFFIFDPINYWKGYPSLLKKTADGNWSLVWALWIGSLICGFAWELWNYHSWPKWIYQIPFVDFWYVFEMPILGYLGYLPFALELYAMYQLIIGLSGISRSRLPDFLQ